MTNQDIYDLLSDIHGILNNVSKNKAKQILRILEPVQQKYHYNIAENDNIVVYTQELVNRFMHSPEPVELFNKTQIKSLYNILADYQIYPTCPLCGNKIKKYSNNKVPAEFSWDHIIPKSLGGDDQLYNLQPTHKGCNNSKGNDMLYHVNYTIEVVVNIKYSMDRFDAHRRQRKKNLRKREFWNKNVDCHIR